MSEPWVLPLDQVGREDLGRAGGKGANLGELLRAGVRVPDGFVVTTQAYAAGAGGSTPAELERAITDAYRALGAGRVAVRSSATAEDLPGAAFAGLQDTFLNIRVSRSCWTRYAGAGPRCGRTGQWRTGSAAASRTSRSRWR